jgi:membrane-bound lytic murein transglycosylase A
LQPKQGNDGMPQSPFRVFVGIAFSISLIAAVPANSPALAHALQFRHAKTETLTFAQLDGWAKDDQATAFQAFMGSCSAIVNGSKARRKAKPMFSGLYNACMKATALAAAGPVDKAQARKFFQDNFKPVRVHPATHTYGFYTGADGFYTGYYESEVAGSRVKTDEFNVPLYRIPKRLVGKRSKVFAQYDRHAIVHGALKGKGLEICWIKNPVDAFFAQIQGSTRIKLHDGELLRLNYVASNGKHYTPVGRILIDQGVFTPEEMSMDKIREYMENNPEEGKALRMKNRSYVFFSETELGPKDECVGAQGIQLTPWRSLAVDPRHHVYGELIWIDAKFPIKGIAPVDKFQHLMVAQDTGSAIKGVARADIYFGHGKDAPHVAGRIKQFGKFVMLVPKDMAVRDSYEVAQIPMPQPRPQQIATQEAMAKGKDAAAVVTGTVTAPMPKPRP